MFRRKDVKIFSVPDWSDTSTKTYDLTTVAGREQVPINLNEIDGVCFIYVRDNNEYYRLISDTTSGTTRTLVFSGTKKITITKNNTFMTVEFSAGTDDIGETDTTLTLSGVPADAKATGDAVSELRVDLLDVYATDTATGATATFTDGADDVPVKSLIVSIDAVQSGNGIQSPDNVRSITGWTGANITANTETIAVDWTDIAGTVYGGTLNVTTGVLTVDKAGIDLSTITWSVTSTVYISSTTLSDAIKPSSGGVVAYGMCERYPLQRSNAVSSGGVNGIGMRPNGGLYVSASYGESPTGIFVYYLETPITYQLAPHEVNTILGTNNIYANTGNISVTYRAVPSLNINRKAFPTDTVSGNIATFTDGADGIPVKDLTVNIDLIQSGSGEPSLDNVRPITGWTGTNITVNTETIAIDWTDTAGTVYSGSLNVTTGVLTAEYAIEYIDGNQDINAVNYNSGAGLYYVIITRSLVGHADNIVMSDKFKTQAGVAVGNTYMISGTTLVAVLPEQTATTPALAKEWFGANPTQFVYKLATPVTYQLTPRDVKTLLGANSISANTGDVNVEYRADPTLYADKMTRNLMSVIAPVETGYIATRNYTSGSLLIVGTTLYEVTSNIANGGNITVGTNVISTTLSTVIASLS